MSGESPTNLAETVGKELEASDATVAVAESSTGGLVGSLLTDVPGSSAYFDRSLVTYSNQAKIELLNVSPATIDTNGAVSEPCARQMAQGVRENAETAWGLSTTGVAGPGGGTDRTPVGTIFIGVAAGAPDGTTAEVSVNRYDYDGTRRENKKAFARQALEDLLDYLE